MAGDKLDEIRIKGVHPKTKAKFIAYCKAKEISVSTLGREFIRNIVKRGQEEGVIE